jgi:hypothetical protein
LSLHSTSGISNFLPKQKTQTIKQTYKPFPFIKSSIINVMAPRAAAAAAVGAGAGAGKPTRGWDATSHEDLLLALLEEIKPNKADLTNVAAKMRSKGYSYSYDAIKYLSFCLLRTHSPKAQQLTCLSLQPARPEAAQEPRHHRHPELWWLREWYSSQARYWWYQDAC